VAETHFDERIAQRYQDLWPELFDPTLIEETVDLLAVLAEEGPALELGIGTGRIGLPLEKRGIAVNGIELSTAMVAQLRDQEGGSHIPVVVGDFATTTLPGRFSLVYLLRNTITNLTSEPEQRACFRNVAAHLQPGGRFVVENYVPALEQLPQGSTTHLFAATPTHLGFEEYDTAAQIAVSHHVWIIDGGVEQLSSAHRYVWPSELDLMARLAGLTLRDRWSSWRREPFTSASRSHISVWEKARAV
jgi:SAM-dependent methyltransferase